MIIWASWHAVLHTHKRQGTSDAHADSTLGDDSHAYSRATRMVAVEKSAQRMTEAASAVQNEQGSDGAHREHTGSPGRTRFLSVSVPVALPLIRQIEQSSIACCPCSPHRRSWRSYRFLHTHRASCATSCSWVQAILIPLRRFDSRGSILIPPRRFDSRGSFTFWRRLSLPASPHPRWPLVGGLTAVHKSSSTTLAADPTTLKNRLPCEIQQVFSSTR